MTLFFLLSFFFLALCDNSEFEAAITAYQQKVSPLLSQSLQILSSIDAADKINEIVESLKVVQQEGELLQTTLQTTGLSSLWDAQNQANLAGIEQLINKISEILDELKNAAADEEAKFREIVESKKQKPKLFAINTGAVTDLTDKISSQTQLFAKTCFTSFLNNVPSSFCWKKGGDFGQFPIDCPDGFVRNLGVCHTPCKSGYTFSLLGCWETCSTNGSDALFGCKEPSGFRFKKSYLPQVLTNFNNRVLCPNGTYKVAALCYRDCAIQKLENCGFAACALSKEGCYMGILKMGVDFILGLGKFVLFIAAKTSNDISLQKAVDVLQTGIKKIDDAFLQKAFDNLKVWIGDSVIKEFMVNLMINITTHYIESKFTELLNNSMIANVCRKVHNEVSAQFQQAQKPNIIWGIDVNEVEKTVSECSKVDFGNGDASDEIMCVKQALKTVAGKDPTGIATMAAAFMNPVCGI